MAEVFTAAIESGEEEEVERSSKNVEIVDESTVVPYYLESFRFIVRSISEDSSLNTLIFEDPLCEVVLQRFEKLQTSAQRLYVRLFLRKHVWLKREKIRYDKEFGDAAAVDGLLDELCRGSFLESHIPEMELEEILGMLSLPQMKELAKQFRIGVGNPSKKELLVLTLKKVREQRTPFGLPLGKIVKNAAVKLLGKVYRVRNAEKEIFMRVLSLFQLTAGFSSPIGENPIFGLLQLNMGVVKFPVCEVLFDQPLFSSLDELKRLEIARGMLEDATLSFEERRFPDVKSIYLKALPAWETIIEDKGLTAKISSLPPYQRKFSSGYLYTKVMERGLEALERLDEKSDAINGYMQLLEQTTYVPHHRGDWFNRLTILLIRVDKRLDAAAKLLLRGIRDHLVRPQHRLELCDRLRRISNRLTAPTRKQITCQETSWTVREPVVVEIRGKLCPTEQSGRSGFHVMFMQQDSASRVEELALTHYLEAGFSQGVHAEGSLFTSLFGLLCWDIIYEQPIANVFRSKYQTAPLDLTCPTFHTSRKTAIEAKIETITGQSIADSAAACLAVWNEQNGVHTPVVSWDLIPSCEYLSGLLHCFQPRQLARIVHRYANDFAAVRAGFPDLTLWNPVTKALKVVEVKGPNDRLSHKQSIWIDFLMDIGVDVEVCHVVASGAKRKSSVLEDV